LIATLCVISSLFYFRINGRMVGSTFMENMPKRSKVDELKEEGKNPS
jgi:hypothetical protein